MHQLHPGDLAVLENLFAEIPANAPMLRAFLEGRVPGHAFVDQWPAATAAVVAVNYRFAFFGGKPSRPFQEHAVRQLRHQQSLDVVWPGGAIKLPHGSTPDEVVARVEYRQRRNLGDTHLATLAAGAPATEVKRIDSVSMRHCLWRDDVLRAIGSTSEFLGHGLGYYLVIEEDIVAEAYAVIWSGGRAEIATVTHPHHRGHGYGTVLCAALIKACEAVELQTYWNCDAENEPSRRLAVRLGYQDPQVYRLVRFSHQPPVSKFRPKRYRALRAFARRLFGRARPLR